jgi:hypothetical protein
VMPSPTAALALAPLARNKRDLEDLRPAA